VKSIRNDDEFTESSLRVFTPASIIRNSNDDTLRGCSIHLYTEADKTLIYGCCILSSIGADAKF